MKYQAIWNNKTIAEADEKDILKIEGNIYFPPVSIKSEYFKDSDLQTTCPWKGLASYYNINVDGNENKDAAWYYKQPKEGSSKLVAEWNEGRGDFSNFVGFWRGVEVKLVE